MRVDRIFERTVYHSLRYAWDVPLMLNLTDES